MLHNPKPPTATPQTAALPIRSKRAASSASGESDYPAASKTAPSAPEQNQTAAKKTPVRRQRERGGWFEPLLNAVDEYAIFALDTRGRVATWNPGAVRLKGYAAEEIIGKNFAVFYAPSDQANHRPQRGLDTAAHEGRYEDEGWRVRKDGSLFWANVVITPIYAPDGSLMGFSKATRDISEQKAAQNALKLSEERFRSAITTMREGLIVLNDKGGIVVCNDRAKEILGLSGDLTSGTNLLTPPWRVIHPDGTQWKPETFPTTRALESGTPTWDALMGIQRPDGTLVWVIVNADPLCQLDEIAPHGVVITFTDVTERRQAEMERELLMASAIELADRDPLTNLYNHRTFHHYLQKASRYFLDAPDDVPDDASSATGRARRRVQRPQSAAFAVAVMDMDNFKFFNDSYGHLVGDEVLCHVANTLQACCRKEDIVARIGGDEFAVLTPRLQKQQVRKWEERLREIAHGLTYQPPGAISPVPLRISIGVALFPDDALTADEVLYLADKRAMRDKTYEEGNEETRDRAERLRSLLSGEVDGFSMLDALVTAVDNKDRYTRHHSEDVMHYATLIAEYLKLGEAETTSLQVAALIHDVGKIGVPNKILRRPGQLSPSEFETIRQHPVLGGLLVGAVPELAHTLEAVRHHHERWDGKGYPSGLHAHEIPRAARILAVADAYSAMTTDRPYRKGMPTEKAVAILKDGAGTQWDAEKVTALTTALCAA